MQRFQILNFVFFILFINIFIGVNKSEGEVYLVGESVETPAHPVIIDLLTENITHSQIELPKNYIYETFYDCKDKKVITVKIRGFQYIEIFVNDINDVELSKPVYSTRKKGTYNHYRSVWLESKNTLCIIGRFNLESNERVLNLICITFDGQGYTEKSINIGKDIKHITDFWRIGEKLLIKGYRFNNQKSSKVDKDLIIDFNEGNVSESEELTNFSICGYFDKNSLIVADNQFFYRYNLKSFEKIVLFNPEVRYVFSAKEKSDQYYAQIIKVKEKDCYPYEHWFIGLEPFNKKKDEKILFQDKQPLVFHSVAFCE